MQLKMAPYVQSLHLVLFQFSSIKLYIHHTLERSIIIIQKNVKLHQLLILLRNENICSTISFPTYWKHNVFCSAYLLVTEIMEMTKWNNSYSTWSILVYSLKFINKLMLKKLLCEILKNRFNRFASHTFWYCGQKFCKRFFSQLTTCYSLNNTYDVISPFTTSTNLINYPGYRKSGVRTL